MTSVPLPGIKWERAPGSVSVSVEEDTGHLTALLDTGSATIRAKLPAPFDAISVREATVKSQKSWALLPAKVEPVGETKNKPIQGYINFRISCLSLTVSRVRIGKKQVFKQLVEGIVSKIRTSPSVMPFNLFTKLPRKINYWRAFVPSPDVGASILNYMTPIVGEH